MRVVALSQVPTAALEPVLETEVRSWREELGWDYRSSVTLIRRHVASGSLPGFAVCGEGGRVAGYLFFVIDSPVAYIGGVYVDPFHAGPECYRLLLNEALGSLKSTDSVDRIECQAFAFNFDFVPFFEEHGFRAVKRHFLSLDLTMRGKGAAGPPELPGIRIVPWQKRFFDPAAEAIYDSYLDSLDFELCRDYQSLEGCRRFLRNLVENPGCGSFVPEVSLAALDGAESLCGVLIASRIGPQAGMIPQLSVVRKHQDKGIGTGLLGTCFREARRRAFERVSLSVSGHNQGAYRLYQRLGFGVTCDFHALIWNRESKGFRPGG